MKRFTFIALILLLFIGLTYGQHDAKFKYVKANTDENVYEIVFSIVGISGDKQSDEIQQAFYSFEEVKSFKIFYNKRCKIILDMGFNEDNGVYADKYREVLLAHDADIDIDYVIPETKQVMIELSQKKNQYKDDYTPQLIPSNQWIYPKELATIINNEKQKGDKKSLEKAKTQWIEDHPEEYKNMTGVEYLDYSIYLDK